jgi:opacity protein-like surface antigen
MRTTITLVALASLALATTARAEETTPAADKAAPAAGDVATAPAPASPPAAKKGFAPLGRRLHIGFAFLPMALGKYTTSSLGGIAKTADASFAYGGLLSINFQVVRGTHGLEVGVAVQQMYNVREKTSAIPGTQPSDSHQRDYLFRLAYAMRPVDTISVYAEVLPGRSTITVGDGASGYVLAFGAGVAMDVTDMIFANIGMGYQIGFQSLEQRESGAVFENRTRFIRVAVGGGVKF